MVRMRERNGNEPGAALAGGTRSGDPAMASAVPGGLAVIPPSRGEWPSARLPRSEKREVTEVE